MSRLFFWLATMRSSMSEEWWWTQSVANLSLPKFPCFQGNLQGSLAILAMGFQSSGKFLRSYARLDVNSLSIGTGN